MCYLCNPKEETGRFQSGQMGLTVTQLSFDFGGSNPSLPTQKRTRKGSFLCKYLVVLQLFITFGEFIKLCAYD